LRVGFLIDGFNMYHSVKAAERKLGSGPLRWLDLHGLCFTLLRSGFGPGATLAEVHYFSALASHLENRKPDVVRRHRTYKSALEATGVVTSFAEFKRKDRQICLDQCRTRLGRLRRRWRIPAPWIRLEFRTHEEKETDVAIACRLLELLHLGAADTVVIVSGDTDLAPAIRTARRLFPAAEIALAFPFERYNVALLGLVTRSFRLSGEMYRRHQLPTMIHTAGGVIRKPTVW